jgi:hypothetical protein
MNNKFIAGYIDTTIGKVPQVSTKWSGNDFWNTIKVRWSIERMSYRIKQGLYAVGIPNEQSQVFVSANYKLSFDHLRRALHGMNAWVLVLDTKGVNVWCAAGKGTLGTRELVYRIKAHEIEKIVAHRKVIVPQLGAVGVSAHEVKSRTGFHVIYGPVQAEDIKKFVGAGLKATPEMRKVKFPLKERVKLIPVEITYGKYYLLIVPSLIFVLSGLNSHGYSIDLAMVNGGKSIVNLFSAYFAGCVLTPMLLPYIPFKRFSLKGLLIGWLVAGLLLYFQFLGNNIFENISWLLMMGSVSSFIAMNFTGATTYTSLSGVQKEMKTALPVQIITVSIGLIGWIITRFT